MGLRETILLAGILGIVGMHWVVWSSWKEGEALAVRRTSILALGLLVWVLGAWFLPGWGGTALTWGLAILIGVGLALLLPLHGRGLPELGTPTVGVDERDIMFSRAALQPGTERFESYYRARPRFRARDDLFRMEPGLLAWGASRYHPLGFPAADAAFWTIERLRPFVEGGGGRGGSAGLKEVAGNRVDGGGMAEGEEPKGEGVGRAGEDQSRHPPNPEVVTRFLKGWARKLGAHSVGVTEVRDYHLYTHVGRGDGYGERVSLDHPFALALTVEMDREMVAAAPWAPTVMESARQYLRSGVLAVQLADLIRRLGYRARAHVDGNYRVICPLVAKDAGLGEIGRMGLLMTPRLGPRVRIAVVTTNLPLAPDLPSREPTTLDFCLQCRKCADSCPARALPFGDPERDETGVVRWKIDAESCFTLWTKLGTDCARCMAVCPFSHPENLLHNVVRWGVRNNTLFRRAAVWLDDLVYGARPAPRPLPDWMRGVEAPGPWPRGARNAARPITGTGS